MVICETNVLSEYIYSIILQHTPGFLWGWKAGCVYQSMKAASKNDAWMPKATCHQGCQMNGIDGENESDRRGGGSRITKNEGNPFNSGNAIFYYNSVRLSIILLMTMSTCQESPTQDFHIYFMQIKTFSMSFSQCQFLHHYRWPRSLPSGDSN